jgi:hypothetical protein
LLIVSPDSLGTACPLSGRNSTYRPVQIYAAGSDLIAFLTSPTNCDDPVHARKDTTQRTSWFREQVPPTAMIHLMNPLIFR